MKGTQIRQNKTKSRLRSRSRPGLRWLRRGLIYLALSAGIFYLLIGLSLVILKWVNPPSTAVHMERRVHSWVKGERYTKHYQFVALDRISHNLVHAAIAAEDARFFSHHGFDWKEMRAAMDRTLDGGKPRGASTITQQLVRNLFLNTDPSVLRKAVEITIVPLTETILGKQRILDLYLNVIEWGPGIYGAQAASRYYFHLDATKLSREQSAQLAAILPAPLRRRPGQVEWYVAKIRTRMQEMGW
jgi:monofunctional glycosyltransferase